MQKMRYKTRFKPLEMLSNGRWHGDGDASTSGLSTIPVVNVSGTRAINARGR